MNDEDRALISGLMQSATNEPCAVKRREIAQQLCAVMGRLNLTLADVGLADRVEDRSQHLHLPGASRPQ